MPRRYARGYESGDTPANKIPNPPRGPAPGAKRREPEIKVSDRVMMVACAGYKLAAELDNTSPDFTMRRVYKERLREAERALTTEERIMLSKVDPRG
jgi:hypothetical protein